MVIYLIYMHTLSGSSNRDGLKLKINETYLYIIYQQGVGVELSLRQQGERESVSDSCSVKLHCGEIDPARCLRIVDQYASG